MPAMAMQDIPHNRNMIKSGRGVDMGDGWETARNPTRPAVLEADDNGILQVLVFILDGGWMVDGWGWCGWPAHNNRVVFGLNSWGSRVCCHRTSSIGIFFSKLRHLIFRYESDQFFSHLFSITSLSILNFHNKWCIRAYVPSTELAQRYTQPISLTISWPKVELDINVNGAYHKNFLISKPSCACCVYVVAIGSSIIINNQILHVLIVFMMLLLVIVSLLTILLPFPILLNPQGSWLWMGSFQAWTGWYKHYNQ